MLLAIAESQEALSSISLRELDLNPPNQINLASDQEEITAYELNQVVNALAQTLGQMPKAHFTISLS